MGSFYVELCRCPLFAPIFVCANPPRRLCAQTGCAVFLRQLPAPTFCVNLLLRLFTSNFVCVHFSRRLLFAPPPRVDFVRRLVAPSFYVNFLHRRFASTCCSVFLRRTLSVSTFRADFFLRQNPAST